MPCSVCISDAKASYDAVQSFNTSNPGKVLYYLADDAGNTTCSSLIGWAGANGIGTTNTALFDNAGILLDQSNYGGTGMPHVVVMGGTDHKIFLNLQSSSNDFNTIQNAIGLAMSPTGIVPVNNTIGDLQVYPNPATDHLSISYSLAHAGSVSVDVVDMRGVPVKTVSEQQQEGPQHMQLRFGSVLSNGFYLLQLHSGGASKIIGFTVAN